MCRKVIIYDLISHLGVAEVIEGQRVESLELNACACCRCIASCSDEAGKRLSFARSFSPRVTCMYYILSHSGSPRYIYCDIILSIQYNIFV